MDQELSAPEAASLLGINVATLYSYVSRGLLMPVGAAGERRKRYPREAVLRLAARKADAKRGGHQAQASMHWGVPVLETCISRIDDGRLYYRGQDALALAGWATLEQTAGLLWDSAWPDDGGAAPPPPAYFDGLRAVTPGLGPLERAMAWLPVLGHGLPAQAAQAEQAANLPFISAQGPALMRGLAAALLDTTPSGLALHRQVGLAWNAGAAECDLIRAALVLLAEHELNSSAFTVRCVASTGASLPAALGAGLAALSGPRHGGSIQSVKALLDAAMAADAPAALVAAHFPADGSTPNGYRPTLYPGGCPRARYLLERLAQMPIADPQAAAIVALCVEEGARRGMRPDLDLALSAMQLAFGWPALGPLTLFALARSAGWIAHAAEQAADPSPIRPRARYVGRF